MISTSDFKTGLTIMFDNNIYQIIEFMHVKPGKGSAFVRTKIRNLRTGSIIDHTFNAGFKLEKAHIEKNKMQFLYSSDDFLHFMNTENFNQIEVLSSKVKDKMQYIYEGMDVDINFYNNEILGISIPDKVTLEVVETSDAVKGDTKNNAMKDAILQTGLKIKVPMFINQGEKIVVSTNDASYVSREK
jgi:elongation factor P|tara:strand:- start:2456 stop:3016 length:561 start_codon:yes stop_codon:yes gene_type:complete